MHKNGDGRLKNSTKNLESVKKAWTVLEELK